MAEISILVPVYNVENYLKACMDSILAQTFDDLEIICMDDGSTDHSGAILDDYMAQDKRIKVVHKENTGYGNTMNMALQLAQGTYIGIVESDDTVERDMYRVMYDAARVHDLDCVKTDFYVSWEHENAAVKKEYRRLADDWYIYNRVLCPNQEKNAYLLEKFTWNALYKRELLIQNNIRYHETPGASYQDNGFWFQTFYWAKRVMFLDQAFYNYRQDNMEASVRNRQKVYAMKNEFDFIHRFMEKQNVADKELYRICFHWRMLAYIGTLRRIEPSLKRQFAATIEDERKIYEERNEAYYGYMTEEQRAIINDPAAYVEEDLIGFTEITKEKLAGYKNIIVYGAGAYGERMVCRVKAEITENQTISVAVTELHGEFRECQGEAVHEIDELAMQKKESLVILAVKENADSFREMLHCLRRLKFPHIMTVSAKRIDAES